MTARFVYSHMRSSIKLYAVIRIETLTLAGIHKDSGPGRFLSPRGDLVSKTARLSGIVGKPEALARPQSCNLFYLHPPGRRYGCDLHSLHGMATLRSGLAYM
jgi:hypothetical protein